MHFRSNHKKQTHPFHNINFPFILCVVNVQGLAFVFLYFSYFL